MTPSLDAVGHLPSATAAYAVLAAAVLTESVLLIGAFVPTLTLLLSAGALARTGYLHLPLVIATAACAVLAGDFLAHRTGRLLTDRLRVGRRVPAAAWRRARALMDRRGGQAVFLGRFVPVLRTLMPHLAGATRLPYRRIAPYSALAAPLWAGAEAGTGYAAAPMLRRAVTYGGPVLAVTALACAGAGAAWLAVRRRGGTRSGTSRVGRGAVGAAAATSLPGTGPRQARRRRPRAPGRPAVAGGPDRPRPSTAGARPRRRWRTWRRPARAAS